MTDGGKVEGRAGARSAHGDLAHVGEVEEAGGFAYGAVLGELAGVAKGHLPAGEVGEGRSELGLERVERRACSHRIAAATARRCRSAGRNRRDCDRPWRRRYVEPGFHIAFVGRRVSGGEGRLRVG